MSENTQVNLEIQPQPKGPLPEVRLKPVEKKEKEKLSELLVHLFLQKFNKLTAQGQDLKNKAVALPFVQKTLKTKSTLLELKQKYSDKEQNKARIIALKNEILSRTKTIAKTVDQKTKLSAKIAPLQKYSRKAFWTEKITELKEDIKEIGQQAHDILAAAIKSRMDKKPPQNI